MKKLTLPLITIAACLALCIVPVFAHTQADPQWNVIYASKDLIHVGGMRTWNDGTNLHVNYTTTSPWVLMEVHLAVANSGGPTVQPNPSLAIPQTKSGNPKVGKFPYKAENLGGITTIEFTIPLADIPGGASPGAILDIAAHAIVSGCGRETAWGDCGTPKGYFPGNNWAMFYYYTVQ